MEAAAGMGVSWVKSSLARLPELEVRSRLVARVVTVIGQRAVDEHFLCNGVDAERVAAPDDEVGHLPRHERAGLFGDAERFRGIRRDPGDGVGARNGNACAPSRTERNARFLVQSLYEIAVIRMDHDASSRLVHDGRSEE